METDFTLETGHDHHQTNRNTIFWPRLVSFEDHTEVTARGARRWEAQGSNPARCAFLLCPLVTSGATARAHASETIERRLRLGPGTSSLTDGRAHLFCFAALLLSRALSNRWPSLTCLSGRLAGCVIVSGTYLDAPAGKFRRLEAPCCCIAAQSHCCHS